MRGNNSDSVLQAHVSFQPPRSRRQIQIKEALLGVIEAGPITGKSMNCVLVRTPFHLSRENPFYLTPLPLTYRLPVKSFIPSDFSSLLSTEVTYSARKIGRGGTCVLASSPHSYSFWTALDTCQSSRELASCSFSGLLFSSWWDKCRLRSLLRTAFWTFHLNWHSEVLCRKGERALEPRQHQMFLFLWNDRL